MYVVVVPTRRISPLFCATPPLRNFHHHGVLLVDPGHARYAGGPGSNQVGGSPGGDQVGVRSRGEQVRGVPAGLIRIQILADPEASLLATELWTATEAMEFRSFRSAPEAMKFGSVMEVELAPLKLSTYRSLFFVILYFLHFPV